MDGRTADIISYRPELSRSWLVNKSLFFLLLNFDLLCLDPHCFMCLIEPRRDEREATIAC